MSDEQADPATRGHWQHTMFPRRAEKDLPPRLKRELEEIRHRWSLNYGGTSESCNSSPSSNSDSTRSAGGDSISRSRPSS